MSAAGIESSHREVADSAAADRWFAVLDQRSVGSGPNAWVAQVLGVHVEADGMWLQIGSAGDPVVAILLHVSLATAPEEVLEALEQRMPGPFDGPEIIDVTRWVRADAVAAATL